MRPFEIPRWPFQAWSLGHWDAQPLTDRAEVAVCREILGSPPPSWWATADEYLRQFNEKFPVDG